MRRLRPFRFGALLEKPSVGSRGTRVPCESRAVRGVCLGVRDGDRHQTTAESVCRSRVDHSRMRPRTIDDAAQSGLGPLFSLVDVVSASE